MSAIAPRELHDEPEPRSEAPRAERFESTLMKPRNPALTRFVFMWDGWHSIEIDDGFQLA